MGGTRVSRVAPGVTPGAWCAGSQRLRHGSRAALARKRWGRLLPCWMDFEAVCRAWRSARPAGRGCYPRLDVCRQLQPEWHARNAV